MHIKSYLRQQSEFIEMSSLSLYIFESSFTFCMISFSSAGADLTIAPDTQLLNSL